MTSLHVTIYARHSLKTYEVNWKIMFDINLKIVISFTNDNLISKARDNTRKINESNIILREVAKTTILENGLHLTHSHSFSSKYSVMGTSF